MGNASSILGEGVLVTYILSPLTTIKANDFAQEDTVTHLRDIVRKLEECVITGGGHE